MMMRSEILLFGAMLAVLVLMNYGGVKIDIGKHPETTQQTDNLFSGTNKLPTMVRLQSNSSLNTKNDTIPKIRPPFITKTVNGQKIKMGLDGKYHKVLKFEDREYPLEIKEVYPNVVYFDKYEPLKILPYHALDSTIIYNRVKDKIEFYNNNKLVNTFIVDEHNPHLIAPKSIKVIQHYNDAEGSYFIPVDKRKPSDSVTEYHLRQRVENQEFITKIIYWKRGLTERGGIIESKSTMIVLDSMGNEIFNHEYNGFCSMPALSPDGQFALYAILPEETVNNAGIKTQTEGFEIWNTKTKTLLHREMNDDPDMWMEAPRLGSNAKYLKIGYTFPNSNEISHERWLFDCTNGKLYSREFTTEEGLDIGLNWFKKYRNYDTLMKTFVFTSKSLNYGK